MGFLKIIIWLLCSYIFFIISVKNFFAIKALLYKQQIGVIS